MLSIVTFAQKNTNVSTFLRQRTAAANRYNYYQYVNCKLQSANKHCIAKGEKTISFLDGNVVDGQNFFP